MFPSPNGCPDVTEFYQYLFSLTEAAFNNNITVGLPPDGFEDWARHGEKPHNIQEVRNKFLTNGLWLEDINGDVHWMQGSQLPTCPPTPSHGPSHYTIPNTPGPTSQSNGYSTAENVSFRDHFDMMQRLHEYECQVLRDDREWSQLE